jgi:hypothetical protein
VDATVREMAARRTTDYVAGLDRFEALPGIGQFVTGRAGAHFTQILLERFEN